jgi:hypothetical protein
MTLDDLDKISERLAKNIRRNKEEVEELIALARLQLAPPRPFDEWRKDIERRVDAEMRRFEKPGLDVRTRIAELDTRVDRIERRLADRE